MKGFEMIIRQRTSADDAEIYDVVKRAFAGMEQASGDEQNLVGRLRKTGGYVPELELVAEDGGRIVGHVMLTTLEIAETPQLILAPLAVAPERQNRGIGGALIKAGHSAAKKAGFGFSVLVGHPAYYPKFGYRPAALFGLRCAMEIPPECFMVCDLQNSGARLDAELVFPPVFFEQG